MAHYCINDKKENNCKFVFKGLVIGTDRKLCNVLSDDEKPCFSECVCVDDCSCEFKKNE